MNDRSRMDDREAFIAPSSHGPGENLWQTCVDQLAQELPEQQFNTWIKPLSAIVQDDLSKVTLLIANRFKLIGYVPSTADALRLYLNAFTGTRS